MNTVMFSWIGEEDFQGPWADTRSPGDVYLGVGPIAHAAKDLDFDGLVLLTDQPEEIGRAYCEWLGTKTKAKCNLHCLNLSPDKGFGEVYEHSLNQLNSFTRSHPDCRLFFNLSSGKASMVANWVLLAKTRFPGELVEVKSGQQTKSVNVPFEIAADYLPDLKRQQDEMLLQLSQGNAPDAPEFEAIIHRSPVMQRMVTKARQVAPRTVPVLIQGESGTGKDLVARAIHMASEVNKGPFIAVNCGAIPRELVESELFGHIKGSFTGATQDHTGYIEASNKGTLFLDEIGELPLSAQVKLLRVLQESQVTKVGSTTPVDVTMRVIAATNRNLLEEVANGHFRGDLFHRLGVAIFNVPPLRKRTEDLGLLIDHFMEQINTDTRDQPGYQIKSLTAGARRLLMRQPWPGNIRELANTLLRAAIWTLGKNIGEKDIEEALLPDYSANSSDILEKPLGGDFKIQNLVNQVATHYLNRALNETGGNKSQAARLVGLSSYQTFDNWMRRHESEKP